VQLEITRKDAENKPVLDADGKPIIDKYPLPFLSAADVEDYKDLLATATTKVPEFTTMTLAGAEIITKSLEREYPQLNEKLIKKHLLHWMIPRFLGYMLHGPKVTEPTPEEK